MIQCTLGQQPLRVKIAMQPTAFVGTDKLLSNTLYYLGAVPGGVSIATFKTAMDAAIASSWAAALSVKYLAPTITIRDMTNYFNADYVFLPGVNAAYVGTITGDSLPPSQTQQLRKLTALSGKMNRGRIGLPMVPESGTTDDGLTSGQLILLNALGTALITPVTAGGVVFTPQLFGPSESNVFAGVTGVYMQPWIDFAANETVRGLKRRTPKSVYA